MKTLKIIFTAVLFLGFTVSNVVAQSPNATADASATVLAELTLVKNTDIAFGEVARGTTPALNPVSGAATAGAGLNSSSTAVGKFTLTGEGDANILVSWTKNDLDGPGADIVFAPSVSYGATDASFGGTIITSGSTQQIDAGGTNYFWVGGTITVASNQVAGTYEGDFTLTVEYN